MEQLFIPQHPPENPSPEQLNNYLGRMFRDIAQNLETIADGRTIEKRHVAPPKPRDGMVVYADGTNWNPGSGEGFYQRVGGAWVFSTDGAVLASLFNANTILKADTDDTPVALTVAEQTLLGRITAGNIAALTVAQVRTLLTLTDAGVKTAYEANADTNEFSDAEQTKLAGIEDGANALTLTLGTKQASTSGTEIDFTGIPAGVKRIIISFEGVSLSGTDAFLVQLGDSGGFETTGYESASVEIVATPLLSGNTTGFLVRINSASRELNGSMTLTRMDDSHLWASSHSGQIGSSGATVNGGGSKTLSAELTQIRITRNGSNTFDNGSINIMHEI